MPGQGEPASSGASIGRKMARGVGWMMLLKFAVRGLGLVSTLILVRVLAPEDFGLVAMAMVFIAMLDVFTNFSFDVVLIQKQSAGRHHYDTAWTFNVIFKTLAALVLCALAYPAAAYYNEPRVTPVMFVLAAGVLIEGLANIGTVDFRKNMEFSKEFRFMFVRKIAAFLVTIPLAFALRSYWALIIGVLTSRIVQVVTSYTMAPYRPRPSLAARGELFNFSKWLVLNNIFHSLRLRSAELIIGRVSQPRDLGLFTVGYEISNMPTTELIAPINRAVFPGYARVAGDLARLREGYLDVVSMIMLFAVPAGAGVAACAPVLVPVALGDQWLAATPLMAILGLFGMTTAMQSNISSIYLALGRPQIITFLHGLHLLILVSAAIPATVHAGIQGTALACLGASLLHMPINYTVLFRHLALRPLAFAAHVWRPLIACGVMYAGVSTLSDRIVAGTGGAPGVQHLLAVVVAGAAIYAVSIALLWWLSARPPGAERYTLDALRARLARR